MEEQQHSHEEQEVMDWTEHLGELRKRLIWTLIILSFPLVLALYM